MADTRPTMGIAALRRYDRGWLRADVLAGITVTAYLVPQVMAYAQLAGVDPAVGLWSAILPAVAYALLGTSRHVSIGPESTTAIMVAAAVAPLAGGDAARYVTLTAALAVLVGGVLVLGWLLRLGFLADLLSQPILVGFMTGVGLIMIGSQLGRLTGVPIEADGVPGQLDALVRGLRGVHPPTLAVGLGTLAALLAVRLFTPRLPGPLLGVVGATVVVAALGLEASGVRVVGSIPRGLPVPALPLIGLADVPLLIGSAVGIALVAYTDGILTGRAFAARSDYEIDPNTELLALGTANLAAGVTSGMPVSSSGSRTAIVHSMGGRSQLVGLVAAASVVLVLLLLGGLLERFPTAALGALVVYAALFLIDVAGFRRLARFRPTELALAVTATAGVLLFDVLAGILIAIGLSVLDVFARVARPPAAILGKAPGVAGLHNVEDYPGAETVPGLVVFRYDAPLCFANANDFRTRALAAVDSAPQPVEWLLLNAEVIVNIDLTAADTLADLHDDLAARGVVLALARVKQDLVEQLAPIGLLDRIGRRYLFPTLPTALEGFERRHEADPGVGPEPRPEPPAGIVETP